MKKIYASDAADEHLENHSDATTCIDNPVAEGGHPNIASAKQSLCAESPRTDLCPSGHAWIYDVFCYKRESQMLRASALGIPEKHRIRAWEPES